MEMSLEETAATSDRQDQVGCGLCSGSGEEVGEGVEEAGGQAEAEVGIPGGLFPQWEEVRFQGHT